MIMDALRFISRCTISLAILAFGYGWLVPFMVSAANTFMVVTGFFLIPFIPFAVWLVWSFTFRKSPVIEVSTNV